MLREVALRRAIEDARTHRARELEDLVARQGALRRRLRELQDRLLALGTVHGRFAKPETPETSALLGVFLEVPATPLAASAPSPSTDLAVAPVVSVLLPQTPPEVRAILAPPKAATQIHAPLLATLASRHPEGFTISQMRDVMDFAEPERPHSYDAAWTLANSLLRTQTLEVAGTRPGPSGVPIRVYRIPGAVPGPAPGREVP